jgi:hypothetical protein
MGRSSILTISNYQSIIINVDGNNTYMEVSEYVKLLFNV